MCNRRIVALASLFGFGAFLIVPPAASAEASNVDLTSNSLEVFAGFGDTAPHAITVSFAGGSYLVSDAAGLTAGEGCVQVLPTSASCADTGVKGLGVYGSAAADKLTVNSVGPVEAELNVLGGRGNDTITADEDSLPNPGGMDLLKGDDGNDTIDGGYGPDIIFGGAGVDTTTYADRGPSEPVRVSIDPDSRPGDIPDGAPGEGDNVYTENVIGGAGNDTLSGVRSEPLEDAGLGNAFTGGPGNDRLLGGPGGDRLNGGAGQDRCVGGSGKDRAKKCERKASL